ncbi:MAG: dioxygenase [Alphaproteobacteria bacterium]|nr:dioxygenase [Alphaproteobacteria bacterium]
MKRMPTLYISHGAGPCFFMEMGPPFAPDAFDKMASYLRGISGALEQRPRAVVVVSAHWEEKLPTVTMSAQPSLIYDYIGFPEHTYHLQYPAAGDPALAAQVCALLGDAGIVSAADAVRGFDHGVFVPFKLIYPQADVPIIQLSLQRGLDPAAHLAIGRALTPLRDDGVLIVGSGFSYHNLREFFDGRGDAARRFDDWVNAAVTNPDIAMRDRQLLAWENAPSARACHPREEHLLPLMVAAGAAGSDTGVRVYKDFILGKAVSGFQFG